VAHEFMSKGVEGGADVVIILHVVGNGVDPTVNHASEAIFDQRLEIGQGVGPPGGDHTGQLEAVEHMFKRGIGFTERGQRDIKVTAEWLFGIIEVLLKVVQRAGGGTRKPS